MDPQQIKAFIDAMAASDLSEMEVSHDGWTLRLARDPGRGNLTPADAVAASAAPSPAVQGPQPAAAAASAPAKARPATAGGRIEVRTPLFGVVHLQQAPGDPPFVRAGDQIETGQLLCIVEAMKVFNEVRAERGGRIAAVLVSSGSEVEADQALFAIEVPDHV